MSRRKERKIKILKSKRIWPKVIGMVITDFLILCFICFLSYLSILGIINNILISNYTDCEKVLSVINKNWNGKNTPEIEKQISNLQQTIDSIQEVYVLDSKFNVIDCYGKNSEKLPQNLIDDYKANILEKIKETPLGIKEIKNQLDDGIIYRSSILDEFDSDLEFIFDQPHSIRQMSGKFFQSFDFVEFSKKHKLLEWGNETVSSKNQWTIYKTDFPDVYVCINNVFKMNMFQRNFITILFFLFVLFSLFCFFSEIFRLISYITESAKMNLVLATDMVTGGKNKDWFIEHSKKYVKRFKRNCAIVQISMEKYNNYCTSYGVKQGENLLEDISHLLENALMKKEISAHLENADFALFLRYESEEKLNKRVYTIMQALTRIRPNSHLIFCAGIVKINAKTDDVNALLTSADLAKNKTETPTTPIVWFNNAMKEEQIWERRVEDDMIRALKNHEFVLYLQPKYSTKNEVLSAAEALVRWIHPELGFIPPGKFIPIFENNGFIIQLDDYMLTEVAKQQAEWMAAGKPLVPISVNVSRAHFTTDNLAEHICELVDKYRVPHKYIELELTESAFFDDKATLLKTVKKLKAFGFAISMDDFGAGYSSLNSLKELPLDVIKLDAEFFRGIDDINRANLIVGDTISLAKKLGMQIVAEGIETREQVDFLAAQKCDLIQGFYFAKPLPVTEFEERAYPKKVILT